MPAPSSIAPIDIACSFRIDRCTCVLASAGPDMLPGQARVPAPSGSCDSPGAAPDYLPERAGSTADPSPALPTSAARISPRPGAFCRPTPLARKRPTKVAPRRRHSPRQSQGLQVAKPTAAPGWGRAITGRLKQIPMFAQVSSCRKHQARARNRVEQPTRADRRRSPPAELTRSGPGRPGLGRPGPARRRAGKSASPSRLAPGSEIGSACRG